MKSKEKKKNISDLLLQSDGAVSVLVVLLGFCVERF